MVGVRRKIRRRRKSRAVEAAQGVAVLEDTPRRGKGAQRPHRPWRAARIGGLAGVVARPLGVQDEVQQAVVIAPLHMRKEPQPGRRQIARGLRASHLEDTQPQHGGAGDIIHTGDALDATVARQDRLERRRHRMQPHTSAPSRRFGVDVDIGGGALGSRQVAGQAAQVAQDAREAPQFGEWWSRGGNDPADDVFSDGWI